LFLQADSPNEERDSRSPPPPRKEQPRSRSRSRSMPRDRSRSRSLPRHVSPSRSRGRSRSRSRGRSEIENPGTTLYVTGLSTRVTEKDLEAYFSKEGKVASCVLVLEPRTRESRGFAFVTMDSVKDAERCIKYLNHSVLEGRYITVERSRRKRPRTPTPGHYLGLKSSRDNDRDSRSSRGRHYDRDDSGHRRSPPRRDLSPRDHGRRSPRDHGRSSRRDRSYSPRGRRSERRSERRGTRSPAPRKKQLRSLIISTFRSKSRSIPRNRSRSRRPLPRPISPSTRHGSVWFLCSSNDPWIDRSEIENPGNTLYVTGLSTKVTEKDLEAHFSKQGKVASFVLMLDPNTRESRGYAFVTMDSLRDAERCIKYLNKTLLDGRYIKVEKSHRKHPRTPTPGQYIGLKRSKDNEKDGDGRSSRGKHDDPDDSGHRWLPRRHNSPRDERKSPRRDHAPRDGRKSPRHDHSPRGGRSLERRSREILLETVMVFAQHGEVKSTFLRLIDICTRGSRSPAAPRKEQQRSVSRPRLRAWSRSIQRARSRSLARPII
ncbi:unnamed protein product, partial [Brassica oleracea]